MTKWKIPPKGGQMDLASGAYIQNMTMKDIKERLDKCDLIIVPLGSTENHGPSACIGEDTFLVTRMAVQVARATVDASGTLLRATPSAPFHWLIL